MTSGTLEILTHPQGAVRAVETRGGVEIYVRLNRPRPRRGLLRRLFGGLIWSSGVVFLLMLCAALGWWLVEALR